MIQATSSQVAEAGLTDQIRAKARELLGSKQVDCVIGYEMGSRGQVRPAFIYEPAETQRLVWNAGCTHNLVRYLNDKKRAARKGEAPPRVAIVVKACDSRALNVLLAEEQIERERITAIGVVCNGIAEGAGFAGQASERLQERCLRCGDRLPVVRDYLIGEPVRVAVKDEFRDLNALDAMSPADRADFWLKQYDRCIRCYACRQACPGCYCNVCMFERDDALWIGIATRVKEKEAFHLGRAYHLAARCVGCNECERVCPMQLPLSLLNRKLEKAVRDLFHYRAGLERVQPPLTTMFAAGEEQSK